GAVPFAARVVHGLQEPFVREVGQAVDAQMLRDLGEGVGGGNQLGFVRRVDAVVAGAGGGRAADPHVDLLGPRRPDHRHDLARGRAAHDRVVDQHDALALEDAPYRVELDLDPYGAD